jgi:hypothetical protein
VREHLAPVGDEGEQAGGVAELAAGERCLRVGIEPGIEDPRTPRMCLEQPGHALRALLVGAHPEREGHET